MTTKGKTPLVLCRLRNETEYALGVGTKPACVQYYLRVSSRMTAERTPLFRWAYTFGYGHLSAAKKAAAWLKLLGALEDYEFPEGEGLEANGAEDQC